MGAYTIHVTGESFRNSDGSKRQKFIRKCFIGDPVRLEREPANEFDDNAIAVYAYGGQIGYIDRQKASWLAPQMDRGMRVSAVVQRINSGGIFNFTKPRGVVLTVRTAKDATD